MSASPPCSPPVSALNSTPSVESVCLPGDSPPPLSPSSRFCPKPTEAVPVAATFSPSRGVDWRIIQTSNKIWNRLNPYVANNRVSRSVSKTIKGYYDGAYPNWSKTPNHVKITWFKMFANEG
ncbi:BnaA03g54640D [Brassica napus]|uniref:BnaA03g54640D protein n=1 Tax=Brassica napus TaxID=3708 RepID=A0A078H5W9_BRANA|nr:BnaA03g54640D [Brassica napus]